MCSLQTHIAEGLHGCTHMMPLRAKWAVLQLRSLQAAWAMAPTLHTRQPLMHACICMHARTAQLKLTWGLS